MRLVVTILLLSMTTLGYAKISKEHLHSIFEEVSAKYDIPSSLLRAVCWAESTHNPIEYNHEDGGVENSSFGICQVLYATAKDYGFNDPKCEDDFQDKSTRTYENCKLFGVRTNINWAAKELKRQLARYNGSWVNAIAAYNTGSIIICKTGYLTRKKDKKRIAKCRIGGYVNQVYIDRVLKALRDGR